MEGRPSSSPATVVAGAVSLPLLLWAYFATAGGFDWIDGWVWVVLLVAGHGIGALWIRIRDPEVLRRRARVGEGTPAWDLVLVTLFGLAYLASAFVAAADVGRNRAPTLPVWIRVSAGVLLPLSILVLTWAMSVNRHFEKTARIQRDRDHRVVDSGPYRFVRHPGYAALLAGWIPAPALIPGSAWALLPAALAAVALVVRTHLEDRMLRRGLEGYENYARTVRFRLLPWIW